VLAQFGIEASRAAQYVIAFAIILVLVALFGVVLRKLTGARLMMPSQDRGRSRQPRLGIVDIYDLDRQRQLVLLRRDNVEHLLLIGGLNDVVIETNIVRAAGARIPVPAAEPGAERFEPAIDQAPRPQVEGGSRPSIETQLAAQLGSFNRRPSEESDMDQELAPVATVSAPLPARPEPILKPDAVTLAASAPVPAPNVRGLRAEARGPAMSGFPPAPEPEVRRPEPGPAPSPSVFPLRPTQPPAPPAPVVAPPVEPPMARPPQPAPADRQAPDAAILSDMARQLEEALRRPAVPTPVPPPQAPVIGPHHADIEDEDELLEPNAAPGPGVPGNAPSEDEQEEEPQREPELPVQARPAEPVRPVSPPPPPPAPAPATTEAPGPARPIPKPADPFSVDEIEAEFARLLGRPLDPGKKE
jgi:flagellar protein FliO/FliZ